MGYKKISDYGIIGNLETAALIGIDGSMDWCCLPQLDSPSIFAAILDDRRGGRFQLAPPTHTRVRQAYREETNILDTVFTTEGGRLRLTDFMPVEGPGAEGRPGPCRICRRCACEEGEVEVRGLFQPRFGYAVGQTHLKPVPGGVLATHGSEQRAVLWAPVELSVTDDHAEATFRLSQGESAWWVLAYGTATGPPLDPGELESQLDATERYWHEWIDTREHRHVLDNPCYREILRSELALKLLISPSTGGIAAAATTSLPEAIGWSRNWDYRFTWVRDASMVLDALYALGHHREARRLLGWLQGICRWKKGPEECRVMYPLNVNEDLAERELIHLEGYRGSRPVRVGNAAFPQRQLDIYGEMLDAAIWMDNVEGRLDPEMWATLRSIADYVCQVWREPDSGMWEVRSQPRHFVSSKAMCWVALDRAILLAETSGFGGDRRRWRGVREEIKEEVLARGWNREKQAFVQHYETDRLDASALLLPLVGFLPIRDPRVQLSIQAVVEDLGTEGLLYRYRGDDGLEGPQGAFTLCSFWLVDCLTLSGRLEEALELFEKLGNYANHLGLYSEMIDPVTGEALGNFPQALSHIGFINSALLLGRALDGRSVRILHRFAGDPTWSLEPGPPTGNP